MELNHIKGICALQAETRTQTVWLQLCLPLDLLYYLFYFDPDEKQQWPQTKQPNDKQNKNSFEWRKDNGF